MKYLASIVEALKKGVVSGLKVTREDSSKSPIELVDEAPPRLVDFVEKPVLRKLEVAPLKPSRDLYALDSSSRVVETPYLFLAIAAGSVFSRFSGRGLDVPSTLSILGLEGPLCKHIVVVPEVEAAYSVSESLANAPGVVAANPLGQPYTSDYNKYVILAELRLMLEQCLLEKYALSEHAGPDVVLFIDGPLIYPAPSVPEAAPARERLRVYHESFSRINRARTSALRELAQRGIAVVGIVKRLHKSYILSSIDPAGLSRGKMSDEAYLSTLLLIEKEQYGQPVLLGPLVVKHEAEYGANRLVWYIGVPRRIYPLRGGLGNYVFYRVEVLEGTAGSEILGYVVYDSIYAGSLMPLSILVVDYRVKRLTSSLVNHTLYLTGLSEEATMQYISVF